MPLHLVLGPADYAKCNVFNRGPTGTLTVVKNLLPADDPGRFDLLVDGFPAIEGVGPPPDNSTGPITVPAGPVSVSERISEELVPEFDLDQYTISTSCVNQSAVAVPISGTGTESDPAVVPVGAGENVTCTITNRRIEEPPPPPPEPEPAPAPEPPPCSDLTAPPPDCAGTDPGPTVTATSLAVTKRMLSARAGGTACADHDHRAERRDAYRDRRHPA
jgi:hypothetical protein